ncbi:MAG TPA: DUF1801 domain-containing protein [Flavitalea sp.]|nr:DUF1801 domain-containing protein [Flavitalea sp.]
MQSYNTIDQYIAAFPSPVQKILSSIRTTIRKTVPQAEEAVKYGIPTFVLGGNLIHFAAFKNHIGIYPGPAGISAFAKELSKYQTSKGTIQLPIDEPIPMELIKRIVQFRVQQTELKAKLKSAKPKKSGAKPELSKTPNKAGNDFMRSISAPARRALAAAGISTPRQLSKYSASQLLAMHGMGPSSIPKIEAELNAVGLALKK